MSLIVVTGMLLGHASAHAFGVDVCFNAPDSGEPPIRNCIGVEEICRTSNLIPQEQLACRVAATSDSVSGLTGSSTIIAGRSLVHSDATYLMAQMIGYTPWQAYQVMIYNEATDQSDYYPFNQAGAQILSDSEISQCRSTWGRGMARRCLVITQVMSGIYKFNDESGGMLLHLHARLSPDGEPPPALAYPTDYRSAANAPFEPLVMNLRDWAFDRRANACVGGILARNNGQATRPCESNNRVLNSPQSLYAAGISLLKVPFSSTLGTLKINDDERGDVLATDRSFQSYITPHQVSFAKLGIYLHTYADRVSHHMCTDRSWFLREASGDYTSEYDSVACAQGSHFLWHSWEQGTEQEGGNLEPQFQTIRPALEAVYADLLENARLRRLTLRAGVDAPALIDRLVSVLAIYDPATRLDAMVALMDEKGVLPLPGHGSVADLTVEQWLDRAGAPSTTGRR
jgi:hypothetical protein